MRVRLLVLVTLFALSSAQVRAESNQVRIGETYGLTHLASYVMVDQHLLEKRAAAMGMPNVEVSFQRVSSGPVVTDLLLSKQIDIAMMGLIPMLVVWDKTNGMVRGIEATSQSNVFLLSSDPHIKSLKDYGPSDRIAMTDVKSTTWAILLQMQAAKTYGWDQRNKYDSLEVPMSNGDATAAMLAGKTEVKSHMTMLPFSATERANPNIHTVINSKDILGHAYTTEVAATTEQWRKENPKLYKAFMLGMADAVKFIAANPETAAGIYQKYEPQKGGVPAIEKLITEKSDDDLTFTTVPNSFLAFGQFMHKTGDLKHDAKSWKDYFFDDIWSQPGS